MRVRMKIGVSGTFHGIVEGVAAGQVVDVEPDVEAERYIKLGYAELADQSGKPERPPERPKEERAVAPKSETAVVKPEVERPKPAAPAEPVKRSPGRPAGRAK